MKRLVRESLFEDFHVTDDAEGDRKFLENEMKKIKRISSIKEMDEYAFEHTMGHMMPLNPSEPLRSLIREKLKELQSTAINEKQINIINTLLQMVAGEQKPFDIPDGAMI